jgi:hypothetical protein
MAQEHEKTIPKNIYFLDLFMDLWLRTAIRKGRFFLKGLLSINKIYCYTGYTIWATYN